MTAPTTTEPSPQVNHAPWCREHRRLTAEAEECTVKLLDDGRRASVSVVRMQWSDEQPEIDPALIQFEQNDVTITASQARAYAAALLQAAELVESTTA